MSASYLRHLEEPEPDTAAPRPIQWRRDSDKETQDDGSHTPTAAVGFSAPPGLPSETAIVSTFRLLPLRVDPTPGEAIDSWLEAIGRQLHTPWNDLLPALGLSSSRHPQQQPTWIATLQAEEAAALSATTHIASNALHEMTLAHYDGRALRIDCATGMVSTRQLWGRSIGSRFCPDCLLDNGGRWLLSWRLGWSFACLIHRKLLRDLCPGCGQLQRMQPSPAGQTSPPACA
ncbi:TniQ family protein [Streptomyces sp. NPDC088253]|uniref:TniQ family protein n=1 Tax=Streptomyces sp. NPDC088253 TaxID=3365846 RepID=UPI00382FA83A